MAEEEKEKISERQIVIFSLGKEEFGVNISEVREIIRMEEITKIPNSLPYIRGVINLRGGIIVVIDLAMKLGLSTKEADKNTRILVVEVGKNTVGMIVDSATEVLRLTADEVSDAPPIITEKINADYIEGVGILGERLLILLDLAQVLEGGDMGSIEAIQKSHDMTQMGAPPLEDTAGGSEDDSVEEKTKEVPSEAEPAPENSVETAVPDTQASVEAPKEDVVTEQPEPNQPAVSEEKEGDVSVAQPEAPVAEKSSTAKEPEVEPDAS